MFSLDPDLLTKLDGLRPTLPGQWRPPTGQRAKPADARRERSFERSLKSGRGFREAQTTAQHLKRSHGHAHRDAVPSVPPHQVHEPRVRHLQFDEARV